MVVGYLITFLKASKNQIYIQNFHNLNYIIFLLCNICYMGITFHILFKILR